MSVNANHYVVLGNRWDYDEFHTLIEKHYGDVEKWMDEVEDKYCDSAFGGITNKNGVTIISDGMNGEYVVAGFVISKSGDNFDLGDHSATPPNLWDDIGDNICKVLGFAKDIEIIAFTHYR